MGIGIWQLVIILVIVLILFGGKGKISSILKDLGKGLKSFKDEVAPEDEDKKEQGKQQENKEK